MIKIRKGLDLPIAGPPSGDINDAPPVSRVALVGDDYVGMKPKMLVQVGDAVKLGQVLFEDKKTPGVQYTSPGSGKVVAVNRGAKRKFESIVIELAGEEEETFPCFDAAELDELDREKLQALLIQSGLWTVLRTRSGPYHPGPVGQFPPRSQGSLPAHGRAGVCLSAVRRRHPGRHHHPRIDPGVCRAAPGGAGGHTHPLSGSGQ